MNDAIEYAKLKVFWYDMQADYYFRFAGRAEDKESRERYLSMGNYEKKKASHYRFFLKHIMPFDFNEVNHENVNLDDI